MTILKNTPKGPLLNAKKDVSILHKQTLIVLKRKMYSTIKLHLYIVYKVYITFTKHQEIHKVIFKDLTSYSKDKIPCMKTRKKTEFYSSPHFFQIRTMMTQNVRTFMSLLLEIHFTQLHTESCYLPINSLLLLLFMQSQ